MKTCFFFSVVLCFLIVVAPAADPAFTIIVKTDNPGLSANNRFILPLSSTATYNFTVDWGDATTSIINGSAMANWDIFTHSYALPGVYTIRITENVVGGFPQTYCYGVGLADERKLLQIANWGNNTWSSMRNAFNGCTNLVITATDGETARTGGVTDFSEAWSNCSSLTSFPLLDTSGGTNFESAWAGCSHLTSFSLINTARGTNFRYAWYNCSGLTSFPLLDTSAGIDFFAAWRNCSGLTSFPLLDTSAATSLLSAWLGCRSLTSFPLLNTSRVTEFGNAWSDCINMTEFPLLDTSAGTNFSNSWSSCRALLAFPLIDTSAGARFDGTWYSCVSLTSFPLINTAAGTSFNGTWAGCGSLVSFPALNTAAGINFGGAWDGCSSLTTFPLLNTANGTNFSWAWTDCSELTNFPLLDTSSGTIFQAAWAGCSKLSTFPLLDMSSAISLRYAWYGCGSLTTFPLLNTAMVDDFSNTWAFCSGLTDMPALDMGNMQFGTWCFHGVTLSPDTYSALLLSLAIQNRNHSVQFDGGNSTYHLTAVSARDVTLRADQNWDISDGGLCHQRYWIGGSGVWSDPSHWTTHAGGPGGAPVPTSSDVVCFSDASGGTCTLDVPGFTSGIVDGGNGMTIACGANWLTITGDANLASLAACTGTSGGLTMAATGSLTPPTAGTLPGLTISGMTNLVGPLTVTGPVSIMATATLFAANQTMQVGGDWNNSGTFSAGTGLVVLAGAGGTSQSVRGSTAFHHLTATATQARTLCFEAGSTQTVAGDLVLSGSAGQLLQLVSSASPTAWSIVPRGSRTCSHLIVTDAINLIGPAIDPTGSVDAGNNLLWFSASGPPALHWVGGGGTWSQATHWSVVSGGLGGAGVPTATQPVIFDTQSGGGTCLLDAPSMAGSLTWGGSMALDCGSNQLIVAGDTHVGELTACSGTSGGLTVAGTGTLVPPVAVALPNLVIAAGTVTVSGHPVDVAGSLTIAVGATLNAASEDLQVGGDWTNRGSFLAGSGSVILAGGPSLTQTISGSTIFHNLSATAALARTLRFEAGSTQTITGTLLLTGSVDQLLALQSTASPATWTMAPTGTRLCSYLQVKDGVNTVAPAIYPTSSVNAGNTHGWFSALDDGGSDGGGDSGGSGGGGCGLGSTAVLLMSLLACVGLWHRERRFRIPLPGAVW